MPTAERTSESPNLRSPRLPSANAADWWQRRCEVTSLKIIIDRPEEDSERWDGLS